MQAAASTAWGVTSTVRPPGDDAAPPPAVDRDIGGGVRVGDTIYAAVYEKKEKTSTLLIGAMLCCARALTVTVTVTVLRL